MNRIWSKILIAATFAGTVLAFSSMPQPADARSRICPLVLFPACAINPAGGQSTIATNKCLARARHITVLHWGKCIDGQFCPFIWAPVCAINPFSHTPMTYPNLCIAEHDNAVWLHNGPC